MMSDKILGQAVRKFRTEILGKTLEQVQGKKTGVKALSAFEHGRSTNYNHIFKYIRACNNEEQIRLFMETLKFVAKFFIKG